MVGQKVSHYKILEKLAEGGMGIVYTAKDTKLKRTTALKFLPKELTRDQEARERFQREAQAAAALNHPNIVTIYEINEHEDQTYIAMEYIEGQTLKDKMCKGEVTSPLQINEMIDISSQVCEGLAKAHQAGIVHRDIKPHNILIDRESRVKILDFGLAKLKGVSPLTKEISTVGTLHYMSPEQAQGEDVDHRIDIWSLGVVMYEMLAGELPFKGDYFQAVVYSILNEVPEPLENYRNDTPAKLIQMVKKALNKDPAQRFQTVDEMLTGLKSLEKDLSSYTLKDDQPGEKLGPSIAVLPFTNMSADPENEYFSDGLSEELINALSHIKELRVAARTSAFSFKGKDMDIREVGKTLNVNTVLEGSVRKAGNRLRITAQLINVEDGYHLWSERYDRVMEDVFDIQDEIALAIVDRLKVKLLGGEEENLKKRSTEDIDIYNLYLKGLYFVNKSTKEDSEKAIECFEQVIERDPGYALAYSGLAYTYQYMGMWDYIPQMQIFPKAKVYAEKALEIDPDLAEGLFVLGTMRLFFDWDWQAAEKAFKRVIELNPNYPKGYIGCASYFLSIGEIDKAISLTEKALEIDPISLSNNNYLGVFLIRAGRLNQAIEQLQKTLELDPNQPHTLWLLGQTYILDRMYDKGISVIIKARELSGNNTMILAGLGWAYAVVGKRDESLKVLKELEERSKQECIRSILLAKIHSGLGNKDQAFQWLDKAYEERDYNLTIINTDDAFLDLHPEPRFLQLLEKIGLKI